MKRMNEAYHIPVMLNECLEGLAIRPDGVYVDLTYGGGGHASAILNQLNEKGRLVAFDQDDDAVEGRLSDDRLLFCNHNFQYFKNFLKYLNIDSVDGVLGDLGVSSHQIDEPERGFSFRMGGRLDMRMNHEADRSAYQFVNEESEEEVAKVLKWYGELKGARKIARAIVNKRHSSPIETTEELVELIKPFFPVNRWIRPMAQVFQAIRIAVNDELGALKTVLMDMPDHIKPGGRLVIMSYHSLEDRLVKNFVNTGNLEGKQDKDLYGALKRPFQPITKKPKTAEPEEIERNPRARSAKLRIAERVSND